MANHEITKLKISADKTVYFKDDQGRTNLSTLLGSHALEALKAAAWRDVAAAISDGDGKIADAATVKAYVDAQIGAVKQFDIVVCEADATKIPKGAKYKDGATEITGTMEASADTMYKLYMVKNDTASAGNYVEWISIRKGTEGAYTYSWEEIGNTQVDLTNYVKKTTQIAGINISDGITTEQLSAASALNLKALAHAATASGTDTVDTIDSITMKEMTIAGNATVTTTSSEATIATKAAFTPSGSITGSAISGGSIDVTVKDATNKTEADLTTATYTPAGNVTGTVSVPNSASISEASAEETGFTITGTVSKPTVTVTPTTATVQEMKSAGTAYTITDGSVTKADDTTAKVAKKAFKFEIDETDSEQLNIVEVASTDTTYFTDAVTASGAITYTKQEISGALPTFGASADLVTGATAALDENPTFTGKKVKVSLANADADISATFAATNNVAVPNKVEYYKLEIDTKTFTPTAATLGFSGTEVADLIPTKITYDKADATAAFSVKQTPETDVLTKTSKTIEITVSPDA